MSPLRLPNSSCVRQLTNRRPDLKTKPARIFDPGRFHINTRMTLSMIDRLDDIVGHLFCVAEQHHRAVLVKQRVVDPGIPRPE